MGARGDWIIDSGATTHMCRNEGILEDASVVSARINVANNVKVDVIGGRRYFLTFVDDAIRKTVVYFLESKTEVLKAFQNFKAFAENQTREQIKRLRTDNGREYVNNEMKEFLQKSGIHHEMTAPYNPKQNGLAERRDRTYVEKHAIRR